MQAPTARSLVLDLLSSMRGHSMPVSALVAAGALFDVAENSIRVSVARLLASRQIERDERGRYRLGVEADAIDRHVRGWSLLDRRTRRWDGGWLAIHLAAASNSRSRGAKLQRRALRLFGFELLRDDLALRPDNLRKGIDEVREDLATLGLDDNSLVYCAREFDSRADPQARSLWDTGSLRTSYRRSLASLEKSEAQLAELEPGEAMVESFLLGGRVLRQLVLDPLLPQELLPGEERDALVRAMRRYDKFGRRAWAAFMAAHGAPHLGFGTPADTHSGETWSLQ